MNDKAKTLGTLQAGSLTWLLTKLMPGDYLMEPDKGEWSRKFCVRSIKTASEHEPLAKYAMTLCFGIQHDGLAMPFRFFRITRVK
ncbi:hypothetical protein B0G84_3250 [Paraburkholderia sp. BL8N3]|nr:hypothetical protein [Paraburkholderia sp. BL8N3]TCK37952.1 hypothetical protein B0G84_3250 [Paraburkholderia sp. BL8N3]